MYNVKASISTKDIVVKPTKRITSANLDVSMFQIARDVTFASAIKPYDPTLTKSVKLLPTAVQSQLKAINKGVNDIMNGVPFTVNVLKPEFSFDVPGMTLSVGSTSRPEIIYTPNRNECQCEGHENHGICKHRLLWNVFYNYVTILRAHEELYTAYAKLGIELKPATFVEESTPRDYALEELYDAALRSGAFNMRGF
jgi:hypothetical protein